MGVLGGFRDISSELVECLSDTVSTVIVADDASMLGGRQSALRISEADWFARFAHDYEAIFSAGGFALNEVLFPEVPTRYCNAILIFQNTMQAEH